MKRLLLSAILTLSLSGSAFAVAEPTITPICQDNYIQGLRGCYNGGA